jgi:hypothetical protein
VATASVCGALTGYRTLFSGSEAPVASTPSRGEPEPVMMGAIAGIIVSSHLKA